MESTQEADTLSRAQLFDLVWAEPMRKLAPRFGLSDVGLAKICRKHGVPTPPVGYWTRVAHGIQDERPELPDLDEEDQAEIRLFRQHFHEGQGDDPNQEKEERRILVQVSERLHRPHHSVRKAKELLDKQKPDEVGLLLTDDTCLKLSVSKATLSRALRILDAVIKAWE